MKDAFGFAESPESSQWPVVAFLSASRDQQHYFHQLVTFLRQSGIPAKEIIAKTAWLPSWQRPSIKTRKAIRSAVEALIRRKRYTAKGQKLPAWRWHMQFWLNMVRAYLIYAQAIRALQPLSNHSNAFLGVWNGKKFRQAIWVAAAEQSGISSFFFERGPLPGYSMVDAYGVNAHSGNPRKVAFYEAYAQKNRRNVLKNAEIPSPALQNSLQKKVFVPFQVVEDSNIYLHSPWVRDMRSLFNQVERLSEAYPDWTFIIKEHPACSETYYDLHQRCASSEGRIRFENDQMSQTLVAQADIVMTVNSTVGIEGLMAGKKVVVLGEALYAIEGLTFPVSNENQLLDVFSHAIQASLNTLAIQGFLAYLASDYAVPGDAMKVTESDVEHWSKMKQKIGWILRDQPQRAIGLDEVEEMVGG